MKAWQADKWQAREQQRAADRKRAKQQMANPPMHTATWVTSSSIANGPSSGIGDGGSSYDHEGTYQPMDYTIGGGGGNGGVAAGGIENIYTSYSTTITVGGVWDSSVPTTLTPGEVVVSPYMPLAGVVSGNDWSTLVQLGSPKVHCAVCDCELGEVDAYTTNGKNKLCQKHYELLVAALAADAAPVPALPTHRAIALDGTM